MRRFTYLFGAFAFLSAGLIYAQFTGPGSVGDKEFQTVNNIKENAGRLDRKDIPVKLKGFIIEQINSKDFWFQDSTGKVKVEIDAKRMPRTPFNEKSEVIIHGEVDADLLEGIELEVKKMILVKP